ncbi:MAG: transglutaminase-like domain-containing protein, partial [Syntrophales bacterium]|nr:transglutaminase-like domain-containing protein [Syntrophales bacterium]
MAENRFPWSRLIGGVLITLFLVLLAFRMDIFTLPEAGNRQLEKTAIMTREAKDTWMNVYQQDRKIGYTHRTFSRREQGFGLREEVFMRIQTMGVVQGISLKTEGDLNQDMTLAAFDFDLTSNLFSFHVRGKVDGNRMSIITKVAGDERRYELPLKEQVQLSQGVFARALHADLKPGQVITVSVFDPMTMGSRPVRLSFSGEEALTIMGRHQILKKYAVDFMGTRQYAWLDQEGEVVREEATMGMALEKTTREDALAGLAASGSADLTDLASVDARVQIPDPAGLQVLKVKLSNIDAGALMLGGGRQTYARDLLTVSKEVHGKVGGSLKNRGTYLASTPFIQASNPAIRAQAGAIVSGDDGDEQKARKIVAWVFKNIEKRPVLSVSNAVETLKNRVGDCTEHAVLVAALGRAAGIPTLVETGLVYQRGRFYYHAWNAFWLDKWGGWVTADAVMNQLPADVTHLRFVRGEVETQLDLMGVVGK